MSDDEPLAAAFHPDAASGRLARVQPLLRIKSHAGRKCGGNGIAVGVNAPPEAIDFLKFFSSVENGNKLNSDNVGLSTVVGTEGSVQDPNLQAVLAGRGEATFMQLYLDQATSGGLSQAFNDATIALFLGESTPQEVCQTLTDAAAAG